VRSRHPYPHMPGGNPGLIELELTSACNAACVFCPREQFSPSIRISDEVFATAVDRFAEAEVQAVKLVGFGEPTLHTRVIPYMKALSESDFEVLLNTNGSQLHRLGVDNVLRFVDEVIFSLHSLDPDKHRAIFGCDFALQAFANLEALLKANRLFGRRITIYIVATGLNSEIDDIVSRFSDQATIRVSSCSNRGLGAFNENIKAADLGGTYNHYPPITDTSPYCWYADAAVVIDALGRYRLCTNDASRTLDLGSVTSVSVANAFKAIEERMRRGGFLDFCRQCDNYQAASKDAEPELTS
jgi:organic radical activating enzyme